MLGVGEITEAIFWELIAQKYGTRQVAVSENLLGRRFEADLEPHDTVLQLIRELREQDIELAILSNTIEPHAKVLRSRGLYDSFDKVFLSHEIHYRKPDSEAYQYVLRAMHADPQSTLFVDDDPDNVAAAEDMGMTGLVFTDAATTCEKIRAALLPLG